MRRRDDRLLLGIVREPLDARGRLPASRLDLHGALLEEPRHPAAEPLALADDHRIVAELGADAGQQLLQGAATVRAGLAHGLGCAQEAAPKATTER